MSKEEVLQHFLFPLSINKLFELWSDLIEEVAREKTKHSVGRRNFRGVKRKSMWPKKHKGIKSEKVKFDILIA